MNIFISFYFASFELILKKIIECSVKAVYLFYFKEYCLLYIKALS